MRPLSGSLILEHMDATVLRIPDSSYRIGRCSHCANRPAYAWEAASHMRIDEARCPRCHHGLNATSREVAHGFTVLTVYEIASCLRRAEASGDQARENYLSERSASTDEFIRSIWDDRIADVDKRLARIRKGLARAAA